MNRWSWLFAATIAAVVVAGCGGSSNSVITGASNPRVSAVNALSSGQTVNVWYNQDEIATSLPYGQVGNAAIETNDTPTINFDDGTTQGVIATENSQTFQLNTNYAVIGYDAGPGATNPTIYVLRLEAQPLNNQVQMRFGLFTQAFGSVDVYVTAPGASLAGTTPTTSLTAASLGTAGSLIPLSAGTFEIRVFASGSQTNPIVDMNPVVVTGSRNRTFLLTANSSNQGSLIQIDDTGN